VLSIVPQKLSTPFDPFRHQHQTKQPVANVYRWFFIPAWSLKQTPNPFATPYLSKAWRGKIEPKSTVPAGVKSVAELLDGFRHVEAASVSDAIEQIIGKKCTCAIACGPSFRQSSPVSHWR
jgi:hypothetical protein